MRSGACIGLGRRGASRGRGSREKHGDDAPSYPNSDLLVAKGVSGSALYARLRRRLHSSNCDWQRRQVDAKRIYIQVMKYEGVCHAILHSLCVSSFLCCPRTPSSSRSSDHRLYASTTAKLAAQSCHIGQLLVFIKGCVTR